MRLRFTERAAADLVEIADYIKKESPSGAQNVRAAILDSLHSLAEFPRIGRRQDIAGVRKLVTRKYNYIVYYAIDEPAGEIAVLTIQHPSRDRNFADK